MAIDLQTLSKYVADCNPARPLDADDPRYVPLDQVRGVGKTIQQGCMAQLKHRIDLASDGEPTCQLFSGFPGTGKTTELKRLAVELERAPLRKTAVIEIDFEQYLDRYMPVSIIDVLRILAYVIDRAATVAQGKDPDEVPGYAKRFWDFLNLTIDVKEANIDVGASLMLELKNNPSFRAKAEEALKYRFQAFAQDAHATIRDALSRLKRAGAYERVVVLADSLEKLSVMREEDRELAENAALSVFVQHAEWLRIPCHAVYTFPLWIRFRSANLGAQFDQEPLFLPMIKLVDRSGELHRPGRDALRAILAKRMDLDSVFGPLETDREQKLYPLIHASGGYTRDLLRMGRDLLMSDEFPVREADVHHVISQVEESYARMLRGTDVELMLRIKATGAMPVGHEADVATFGRLLERFVVLGYRNGRDWYRLHPLVERAELLRVRPSNSGDTHA